MTHLRTEWDATLLGIWRQMLEPQGCDLLIVESKSPYEGLPDWPRTEIPDDDAQMAVSGPRNILAFRDKRGHPFHDGVLAGAGSDRAMMMGFQTAINSGYERVVYLEMDLLFARPLSEAFAMMTKPAACLPLVSHGKFPEVGLFIADCQHMREIDFVARYDWKGPTRPEGELRQWRIYGDDLQFLPFRGCRDANLMTPQALRRSYPDGIDWLTHVYPETALEFCRMNGISPCG